MTGVNDRNLLPRFELRWRDVNPVGATVSSQVNQAVVGSRPDAFDIQRRWRNGIDDTALGRLRSWLRAVLADRLGKFESFTSQIRTNLLPVSPAVSCLPQCVGSKVGKVRFGRGKNNRLGAYNAKG